MFSHIVRFFQGGGWMMYPIAVVLVAGLAIALERFIYLTQVQLRNRKSCDQHHGDRIHHPAAALEKSNYVTEHADSHSLTL